MLHRKTSVSFLSIRQIKNLPLYPRPCYQGTKELKKCRTILLHSRRPGFHVAPLQIRDHVSCWELTVLQQLCSGTFGMLATAALAIGALGASQTRHAGRVFIALWRSGYPLSRLSTTHRNACHVHDKRFELQLLTFVLSIDAHIWTDLQCLQAAPR
jgi:hypothetical protein